jgi:hypothetical protein
MKLEFAQNSVNRRRLLYFQSCRIRSQTRKSLDGMSVIQIHTQHSLLENTWNARSKTVPPLCEGRFTPRGMVRRYTTQHCKIRHGTARRDKTRQYTTRHDTTRYDNTPHGKTRQDTTRFDTTRQDTTRNGSTRHDTIRQYTTRQDTTRFDTTMQDTTWQYTTRHEKLFLYGFDIPEFTVCGHRQLKISTYQNHRRILRRVVSCCVM